MKVAIVHDWLTVKAGGERCVEQFLELYPDADIFTIVDFMNEQDRAFLGERKIITSFIQKLPGARKHYRTYLPLMPVAIEQFDLSAYDLVLSSSTAVAKGVVTGPYQVHVAYVNSPIRYAWDLQHAYLKESGLTRGVKGLFARIVLHYIRIWDYRTAAGVDYFIANSKFIKRRIMKTYRLASTVIHPPVDIERFTIGGPREKFYVAASRMVPYKRMPMIAEAFARMPDRQLVIIGDGPEMPAVRAAGAPNIQIMGYQPDDVLVDHMRRAKAFIFAAEEDFGIMPLEAQACGTPVVAYARGGSLETIRGRDGPGQTGVFFDSQTAEALIAAVRHLDTRLSDISAQACRKNAERFSNDRFRDEMRGFIDAAMADHARENGMLS